LLDRIDLAIDVPSVLPESLALNTTHALAHSRARRGDAAVAEPEIRAPDARESSVTVRSRVERARACQRDRQGKANARLLPAEVSLHCVPEEAAEDLLAQAMARLALSARAYHRILKVARTIADLAACERINVTHVAEAIGYRRFDNS
jgi:magnesium chelatase family protein